VLPPDPIPELKIAAATALVRRIAHWSSAGDAAAMLGTDRGRILDVRHGRLKRFSLETLLRLLVRAGERVEWHVAEPSLRDRNRAALIDAEQQRPRSMRWNGCCCLRNGCCCLPCAVA